VSSSQYAAETASIIVVQLIVGVYAHKPTLTLLDALLVALLYPASLALVALLEGLGFN